MTLEIDIGGYEPEAVLEADIEPPGGDDLSTATVRMGATADNLATIEYGDRVIIEDPGQLLFTGYVIGIPSRDDDGVLEVEALDDRVQLKHEQANRVFYQLDSAEAVRQAVDYEAVPLDERTAVTGDQPDDWSGNMDVINPYTDGASDEVPSRSLYEVGSDMMYLAMEPEDDRDETGVYRATKTNLPDDVVGDGQLRELTIRYALSLVRGEVAAELELRAGGRNYVWDLDPTPGNIETVELSAADADADGELDDGPALEVRYDVSGSLDEAFGMLLDAVWTTPFRLEERDSEIVAGDFPPTGRTITREHTGSVLSFVNEMATEDGRTPIVDEDQRLEYLEDAGTDRSTLDIVQGETAVVDVQFDRDAEEVTNRVQVNGDGVQATAEDPASIEFYGVAPRNEPIVEPSIKTHDEAGAKARGYLEKNAWSDVVCTFDVADRRYADLSPGDNLFADWPAQAFSEYCVVRGVSTTEEGIVELDLGVVV